MVLLSILAATLCPSDMKNDYAVSKGGHERLVVLAFEDYGRHIKTLLPFVLALVLKGKECWK